MSKQLLYILLLISLAFNLAFIGSFLYWRHQFKYDFMNGKHPHEMRGNRPPQWDGPPMAPPGHRPDDFGWMGNKQIIEPYREKFAASKEEFFKALQQPVVNEEVLKQKLEASLQNHTALEKQIGLRLIEMRKKMTSQQANEFFGRHMNNSMKHDNDQHRKRRTQ
jgi:hypothetical protein